MLNSALVCALRFSLSQPREERPPWDSDGNDSYDCEMTLTSFSSSRVRRPQVSRVPPVVLPLALLGVTFALTRSASIDDAYISYRYAANLAAGRGLVLNVGERVEGISNMLWTLALSLAHLAAVPLPVAGSALGLLSVAGSVLLTDRLCRRLGAPPVVALLTACSVAVTTDVVAGATMGLEGGLFGALLLLVLVSWDASGPTFALGVIALGATRPEGLAIGAVLAVLRLAMPLGEPRRRWWPVLGIAGLGGVELARLALFGRLLPTSVTAKRDIGLSPLTSLRLHGRDGLAYLVHRAGVPALVAAVVLVVALVLVRRRVAATIGADLVPAIVVLVAGALLPVLSGGDWMPYSRLIAPYFPVGYVAVAVVLARTGGQRAIAVAAVVPLVLAAVGHHELPLRDNGRTALDTDRGFDRLGRALEHVGAASGARGVLATDVLGRPCFWAPSRRCSDILGLAEPAIAGRPGPGSVYGKTDYAYTLSLRPAVLATDTWPRLRDILAVARGGSVSYVAVESQSLTRERVFVLADTATAGPLRDALRRSGDRGVLIAPAGSAFAVWDSAVVG